MKEYYVKSILQLISGGYNIGVLKEIANSPVLEKHVESWYGSRTAYTPYKIKTNAEGDTQKVELDNLTQYDLKIITTKKPTAATIKLDAYLMEILTELHNIEADPNQVELIFKQKAIINSLLRCLMLSVKQ
jgi:hypothetical protein